MIQTKQVPVAVRLQMPCRADREGDDCHITERAGESDVYEYPETMALNR